MRRLHAEASRRLLGNGYCTRPAEIGCRYETICEGCSFFATTITFRDQIQAQHDDADRTDGVCGSCRRRLKTDPFWTGEC